jgi:hypothetical protein
MMQFFKIILFVIDVLFEFFNRDTIIFQKINIY